MSLLNRAATGVFTLALVSALLIGGHWIAGGKKRRTVPARAQHTTSSSPVVSWMPDCKMPESPPASGPVRSGHLEGFTQLTSDGDRACLPAKEPFQSVIYAASKREAAPERAGSRVADASESSASPFSQPMPLPARTDAIPLRPEGPDLPSVAEPPVSAPWSHGPNSLGRRIIERELPNSTAEERDAWHDALKDLAPKDVRELMRLRQELGRMPPSLFESRPPVGQLPVGQPPVGQLPVGQFPVGQLPLGRLPGAQPLWSLPVPGQIASEPIAPPGDSPPPRSDAEREVARTIGTSLDTITQAQQVLLNNIANASTDGYKRIAISLEGVSIPSAARHSALGAGVRLGPAVVDMSQGKLRHTDRSLDLAVDGEGFFQLEDRRTKQTFYTRYGRFAVTTQGELIWRTALRELHLRPAVKIAGPESDVEIASDGTVGANTLVADAPNKIRKLAQRIQIVRVPAFADLTATGENLFAVRGEIPVGIGSESDPPSGRVRQGCLEESNVDVEHELHELEHLRRQAHAMELGAQSLLSNPLGSVASPSDPNTIPSHFAGVPERDRR